MGINTHLKQRATRSVPVPEFSYCIHGTYPYVFVFDRERYILPSRAALAEYDKNKAIVESLGGRMLVAAWQAGGERMPFTEAEVAAARAAVSAAHPDLEIVSHWNGEGCYTLSIGCRKKGAADGR